MSKKKTDLHFFVEIIKSSIKIIRENKFLLWFGFFVALNMKVLDQILLMLFFENVQGDLITLNVPVITEIILLINQNQKLLLPILVLIIFLFLLFLSFLVAPFILSVKEVLRNKEISLKENFKKGKVFVKKLMGLHLVTAIFLIAFINIFDILISLITDHTQNQTTIIFMSIAALLIILPALAIVYFVWTFSQIYVVRHNLSAKESIRNSYELLDKNIKPTILMFLFLGLFFLNMVIAGILIFVVMNAIIFPPAAAVLLSKIALFLIEIFFITLCQTAWILFFTKIAARKDIEKSERATALEKETALG